MEYGVGDTCLPDAGNPLLPDCPIVLAYQGNELRTIHACGRAQHYQHRKHANPHGNHDSVR